jgi:hypothetical protein
VRKAVGEFVPELAAHAMVAGSMQIFDFSERKQSNQAATLVPARRFGGSPHAEVLVTRVGDALQEPFWPEVRSSSPPPPRPPRRRTWRLASEPCRPACTHLVPLSSSRWPTLHTFQPLQPATHRTHAHPPTYTRTRNICTCICICAAGAGHQSRLPSLSRLRRPGGGLCSRRRHA